MKEYVLGFAIDLESRKVLLIQKTKPEWQRGRLNGLGGSIEDEDRRYKKDNEGLDLYGTISHAMAREFQEESGIVRDFYHWYDFGILENSNWKVYCLFTYLPYFVDPLEIESDEGIVKWYDIDNLPDNVLDNLHWLISSLKTEEVRNGKIFIQGNYNEL